MSRAGLFSGTVTESAPADNAPTTKHKGHHWMQWGVGMPVPPDPSALVMMVRTDAFQYFSIAPPELGDGGAVLNYNYTIDWGDGNTDTVTAWGGSEGIMHLYEDAGDHIIIVTGLCEGFGVRRGGDSSFIETQRLIEIRQWGDLGFRYLKEAFRWSVNVTITATDKPNLTAVTDMEGMFRQAEFIVDGLAGWDTSGIVNMQGLFQDGGNVAGLETWNTSSVTNMRVMFASNLLFNRDISMLDYSQVTDMTQFLYAAGSPAYTTANYDALLAGLASQTLQPGVVFWASPPYTIATSQANRDILTSAPNNWLITDGGGI